MEVDNDFTTMISSYSNFEEAQENYLKRFINTKNNVVLTCIDSPSFGKISTAYSNYVLTIHQYEKDIFRIIEEIMKTYAAKKDVENLSKYREFAKELFLHTKKHIHESISKIDKSKYQSNKIDEWLKEMTKRIDSLSEIITRIYDIKIHKRKNTRYGRFIDWLNT